MRIGGRRARARVLTDADLADLSRPARRRRLLASLDAATVVVDRRTNLPLRVRTRQLASLAAARPVSLRLAQADRGEADALTRAAPDGVRLRRRRRRLTMEPTADVLVKLSEADLTAVLARDPSRVPALGVEVEARPGAPWTPRGVLDSSDDRLTAGFPTRIPAGRLALRRHADVTCVPGQIAVVGRVLLPVTFRKAAHRPLHTSTLVDVDRSVALRPTMADPEVLEGPHLYLDNLARPHFGHALTEQVSQLWGWRAAYARDPDLRLLLGDRHGRTSPTAWELELYAAAGVPSEAIHVVDRPVLVRRLYTASPMYRLPDEVHPAIGAEWDRLGRALAARAGGEQGPARVFLTRRTPNRACRNAEEVEALFAGHGFRIVRPETLPLPEQIALVRGAEVVAGFAGSGMFGIALAGAPKHVVTVGSASYSAINEHLMSAVVGHRLDMAFCTPEVVRGPVFDRRAFQSAFTFDATGPEGRFVRRVLAGLD